MKSQILKPTDSDLVQNEVSVFLAGTIEMGKSEDWQSIVQERLKDLPVTFFNPRRDSWDSSWEQRETNKEFNKQVNWEIDRLKECSIIFMNILPDSKSPISLLELGLFAESGSIIICCPDGFYRKGNIEVVCSRYKIPLYDNFDKAIGSLESLIAQIMSDSYRFKL